MEIPVVVFVVLMAFMVSVVGIIGWHLKGIQVLQGVSEYLDTHKGKLTREQLETLLYLNENIF